MKYSKMLDNLLEQEVRDRNESILLIDGLNTFIRSFASVKALNPQGSHVGGMTGFLRSLGYLVRTLSPTRVLIVFDGLGSSTNRKNINPNYKANREFTRITNWGAYDSKAEERAAMADQIQRLEDYLDCLPVQRLTLEKLEADDVMSFVADLYADYGRKATLVSSDRDFLQLCRPGITVFAPIKRALYTHENVQETIKVLPENYHIAKALLGDASDNLVGVNGLGIKTLIKIVPKITFEKIQLEDVYKECEKNIDSTKKIYSKIIHSWDLVKSNYKLMNLHESVLDDSEIEKIKAILKSDIPKLNMGAFLHYLDKDRIDGITKNTEAWLETFRPLTLYK